MWFGLSMFLKKRWSFEPKFDAELQGWPQDRGNSASLSSSEHSFVPGSAKNSAALWAVARDQRFKMCCPNTQSPSQALPPALARLWGTSSNLDSIHPTGGTPHSPFYTSCFPGFLET